MIEKLQSLLRDIKNADAKTEAERLTVVELALIALLDKTIEDEKRVIPDMCGG